MKRKAKAAPTEGIAHTRLLDFNATRSVVPAGNPGAFKPQARDLVVEARSRQRGTALVVWYTFGNWSV